MYTQAYNTPKPVDRGGPEQPAMLSSETDSAVCVSRYYNKYIYKRSMIIILYYII